MPPAPKPLSPLNEERTTVTSGNGNGGSCDNVAKIAGAFVGVVTKVDGGGTAFVVKFDQSIGDASEHREFGYVSSEGVKDFTSVRGKLKKGVRVVGNACIDDRDLALITSIGLQHVGHIAGR